MNVADLFKNPPADWAEPDTERRLAAIAWAEPFGDDIERALAACADPWVLVMILAGTAVLSGDNEVLRHHVFSRTAEGLTEAAKAHIARAFRSIGKEPARALAPRMALTAHYLRLGGEPRRVASFASLPNRMAN